MPATTHALALKRVWRLSIVKIGGYLILRIFAYRWQVGAVTAIASSCITSIGSPATNAYTWADIKKEDWMTSQNRPVLRTTV